MAWPATRLANFTNDTVPAVDDAFLNALQDGVIGITVGTISLKSLQLDGTGGLAVAALPGCLIMTGFGLVTGDLGSASGGALPMVRGQWARDLLPFAWAAINSAAGGATPPLYYGANVTGVTRSSAGNYQVTIANGIPNANKAIAKGTALSMAGSGVIKHVQAVVSSTTTIDLRVAALNPTGPAITSPDSDVGFILYAGT